MTIDQIKAITRVVFECPLFSKRSARKEIIGPMPDQEAYEAKRKESVNDPLFKEPLLNREQEHHLSRQMHYWKWMASKVMKRKRPCLKLATKYCENALAAREQLIKANILLATGIANECCFDKEEGASEAYFALLRVVDYFDYRFGTKCSTYATLAIRRHLWRTGRTKWRTDNIADSCDFEGSFQAKEELYISEDTHERLKRKVDEIINYVGGRESVILRKRFEGETLRKIGTKFGISKERVRQIEKNAQQKIAEKYTYDSCFA